MNNFTRLTLLIILGIVLASCTSKAANSNKVSIVAPEFRTAAVQTLTAAVTPTKTSMPTQTATSLPTITPTPAATNTPTTTPAYPEIHFSLDIPSANEVAAADSCNRSIFLRDVTIKDGTVLMPGETFKKIWRFENTGSCAWKKDYNIIFVSGLKMDGETTTINQYVAPGKTADIHLALTAPDVEGTFTGYWMLANENEKGFGEVVYVQIVVSEDEEDEEPE